MKYEMLGACLDYHRPLHLTRHNTLLTEEKERHSSHGLDKKHENRMVSLHLCHSHLQVRHCDIRYPSHSADLPLC